MIEKSFAEAEAIDTRRNPIFTVRELLPWFAASFTLFLLFLAALP